MFLVLKKEREEKEDFTATTFTNLQEEWDIQPESTGARLYMVLWH